MNFYPFHIGDYASATRHLSWLEDAAYRRLLDVYYVREEPLPLDLRQVYRLVVARSDEEREAVDVVLEEFFVESEDGYRHARCDAEIAAMQGKRDKASISAQKRWRSATKSNAALLEHIESHCLEQACAEQTESERNANASTSTSERIADERESTCEGNATNPKSKPKTNTREPDGFAEFWFAYPKKVGKGAAEKAFRSARIHDRLDVVLAAVRRQAGSPQWLKDGGQYIPNPATWLNQRRWEDGTAGHSPGMPQRSTAADPYPQYAGMDPQIRAAMISRDKLMAEQGVEDAG